MALTEARKAYLTEWRGRQREYLREYHTRWRRANGIREGQTWRDEVYGTPEERVAKKREYRRKWNKTPKRRAYVKDWEARNRDRVLARLRKWQRSPKGKAWMVKNQSDRRCAKGRFTEEQLFARIQYFGGRCWMCGAAWESVDHVIPIARGGTNWPANLRPACGKCNSHKGARPHQEVLNKKWQTRLGAHSASVV